MKRDGSDYQPEPAKSESGAGDAGSETFKVTVVEQGYSDGRNTLPGGRTEIVKTMLIELKFTAYKGVFPVLLMPYLALGKEQQLQVRKMLEDTICQSFVACVGSAVHEWSAMIAQNVVPPPPSTIVTP